jgi:hypothetical protein
MPTTRENRRPLPRQTVNALLILVITLTTGVLAQSERTMPGAPDSPAGQSGVNHDRQDSLATAQQLYASADYQSALGLLDRLMTASPSGQDRQSIDLYRTLCFVALGRSGDADAVITDMITRDPLYRPMDSELPPRLRSMFTDKRRLLLPSIVQSKYKTAKGAFDVSDYRGAAEGFAEVLNALSDPDIAGPASRPPLSDLRVLAVGFNDLAIAALAPPPVQTPASTSDVREALPTVDVPRLPKIYDSNDEEIVAPITLKQEMPRFPRSVLVERTGVLFIVIDETGGVESAIITESLDRAYDRMLLAATNTWTYQPATRNGIAVKFRKRIQLTLPRQMN